jgi:phosphoglycolate phosphatase-like HAD superfamily hydrolase
VGDRHQRPDDHRGGQPREPRGGPGAGDRRHPRPGQLCQPDPDLFVEAARRLGTTTQGSYVIGDSIWDMLAAARCGSLGIGLLSGGYGREELERAGALRVYDDPADMLDHLDEIAPRTRV